MDVEDAEDEIRGLGDGARGDDQPPCQLVLKIADREGHVAVVRRGLDFNQVRWRCGEPGSCDFVSGSDKHTRQMAVSVCIHEIGNLACVVGLDILVVVVYSSMFA